MKNCKKAIIIILVGFISIAYLVNFSHAATLNIIVPAGEEVNHKIDIKIDDRVIMQFTVVGGENSLISFSLLLPNATEITFGDVGVFDYSFISDIEGEYVMNFINTDMNESKLVTLNYDVEHYLFGMPQMFFLAIVITGFCLLMLGAFVLLGQSS